MHTTILNKIYDVCNYLVYGEQTLDSLMCHSISPNKLIEILKKRKTEINTKDEHGNTPFIYALSGHQPPKIIEILLENGADPSIVEPSSQFNSLHFAINNLIQVQKYKLTEKEYIEIIQLIDQKNKHLMNQPEKNGITPADFLIAYPHYLEKVFPMDGFVLVNRS